MCSSDLREVLVWSNMTVPEVEEKVSLLVKSPPMVMVRFWVEWASKVPPVMVRSLLMSMSVPEAVKVEGEPASLKVTL